MARIGLILAASLASFSSAPGSLNFGVSCRVPTTRRLTMSIFDTEPANSHVNSAKRPSIEKSAWLMPGHSGVGIENSSFIVCGSRKSRRSWASATTIAYLPSGEKYRLYGSSTGTAGPGLPVFGSIGVRLPLVWPSALLATHSVFRSHDGTTCWGSSPTLYVSTTFSVAGSITDTEFDPRLGTYTRSSAPATAGASLPAAVSLYRFFGSITGGMPGRTTMPSARAGAGAGTRPG